MVISNEDVAPLTVLLSPERLGPLAELTGNSKIAIELHQETLRLGANLMNIIASIEIALRNTVCNNLGQHFGVPGWLLSPPLPFLWRDRERDKIAQALDSARRAEYSKLSQSDKHALDTLAFPNGRPPNLSHAARSRRRRDHITVTDGKVIAELTFYIWKRIYGPDYEHSLWRPALKKTFPDKGLKRAQVAENLEVLYQARNRLAHHEPVLYQRFAGTITSVKFISQRLTMPHPTPDAPLARLISGDIADVEIKARALHKKLDSYRIQS